MIAAPLAIPDVIAFEPRVFKDARGFFFESFNARSFAEAVGRPVAFVQDNFSHSAKGVLRGMHYQLAPKAEDKIVRCLRGALLDVIVDLRPDSPTFLKHFSIELSAENRTMLFVPKGFAHGFLTLTDETEAFYLVTEFYSPQHERGLRYNDPRLAIRWPFEPAVISDKDRNHPDFDPKIHLP